MALRLASKINRHFIQKNAIKINTAEKSTLARPKCLLPAATEEEAPTAASKGIKAPHSSLTEVRNSTQTVSNPILASCHNKYRFNVRSVSASSAHNTPFKLSRLMSPFPEPVKVMPSDTLSDLEKADQKFSSSTSSNQTNQPLFNGQKRNFCETGNVANLDPSKCKKINSNKKKMCPRMVAPGCKPPKTISCSKRPINVECTKKEAPYPSYSETCHEDLEMKPSECRMCPWKPEDNPNFKPPKSKMHTSAVLLDLRKGDCGKIPGLLKEPCGWVKEGKDECGVRKNNSGKKSTNYSNKKNKKGPNKNKYNTINSALVLNSKSGVGVKNEDVLFTSNVLPSIEERRISGENNGYLCDMRKEPCKQPPPKPCGEQKKPRRKEVKKKKREEECPDMIDNVLRRKREEEKEANNPKKAMNGSLLIKDINKWLLLNGVPQPASSFSSSKYTTDEGGEPIVGPSGSCKKMPFDKCIKKKRKSLQEIMGGCPPKPKKKKMKDCPPDPRDCEQTKGYSPNEKALLFSSTLNPLRVSPSLKNGMLMQESGDSGDKKKCPKVNVGLCKDDGVDDDDPCHRKRKGRTDVCKPNLLERYKNKKDKPKSRPTKSAISNIPLPITLKIRKPQSLYANSYNSSKRP